MKEWEILFFMKHYPKIAKDYFIKLVQEHYEGNGVPSPCIENITECYEKYIDNTTVRSA